METIIIKQEHKDFVAKYAPNQDVGGFSNLSSSDLQKSSRLGFQHTGIWGEVGFHLFAHNSIEQLGKMLAAKVEHYHKTGQGDGGFDDKITHNGKTRLIDIKTTHIT